MLVDPVHTSDTQRYRHAHHHTITVMGVEGQHGLLASSLFSILSKILGAVRLTPQGISDLVKRILSERTDTVYNIIVLQRQKAAYRIPLTIQLILTSFAVRFKTQHHDFLLM